MAWNASRHHYDPDYNKLRQRSTTKLKYIIIHCTAALEKDAPKQTIDGIRDFHMSSETTDPHTGMKGRGWHDIGYHYVIMTSGTLMTGRDMKYEGCHTAYFNTTGIGLCYCGGCGKNDKDYKDTRTDAQKQTMYTFVHDTLRDYAAVGQKLTVHGHYQFSDKGCPCFNVEQWLIDTGLTTEFPWLEEGSNMKMYRAGKPVISKGKKYCGGGCKVKTSGVNPLNASRTDSTTTSSSQSYNSPYQEQRNELAKRISASTSSNINYLSNNMYSTGSIFASPFYYLQNGYYEPSTDENSVRKYVKTLLFLHTLPWDYDAVRSGEKYVGFFNNTQYGHGGIELVPSGWVYLLGGLVWRNDYYMEHDEDPIAFGFTRTASDGTDEYVELYRKPKNMYTPLLTKNDKEYVFTVIDAMNSQEYADSKYDLETLYNTGMDYYVSNALKESFMEFADKYYPTIESLELSVNVYDTPSIQNLSINDGNITYAEAESMVLNKAPIKTEKMTYTSCSNMVNTLKGCDLNTMLSMLGGRKLYQCYDTNIGSIKGFAGHYAMGFYTSKKGGVYLYYHESFKPAEDLYNMTYGAPLIVTTNTGNKVSDGLNDNRTIYEANYKSYLYGFCDTLVYYVKNAVPTVSTGNMDSVSVKDDERDFKCEIYLYLKNLWDRWLCGFYYSDDESNHHFFNVNEFFHNFVFIDTFYNNIGIKLRLNCNHLLEQYTGGDSSVTNSGKSIVNHLGNVVSKHQCVMFNFPDYVDFCGNYNDNGKQANLNVKDMFVPQPQLTMEKPSIANMFVIIYTHTANFLETTDRNKFIPDTFDIWSCDEGTGVAPSVFNYSLADNVKASDHINPENKMGYKVPAFGVAYSRQNNSYWKNISVGMDTQTMTEQAARSYAQIAEKGNSSKKKLCFYGQDIYSIYQAYSYTVTIEMMGCAKIQPLMYFQLMNIPMFRGTYMIIKVEHHLKAGDMTTTFTGMKMSKVQKPFTQNWFTTSATYEGKDVTPNADTSSNGSPIRGSDGVEIDIEDNKLSDAINKYIGNEMLCDVFVRNVYKELGVTINHNLAYDSENKNMYTEMNTSSDWNMKMFKKLPKKSNNWQSLSSSTSHPDVGEILLGYHNGKYGEIQAGTGVDKHMHVAIYLGMHNGKHYIVEGGDSAVDKSKTGISNNKVMVSSIDTSMMSESDDVYTHHCKCNKITIEQHKEVITRDLSSNVAGSTTQTGQPGEVIADGKVVAIQITNPVKLLRPLSSGESNPTPSDLSYSSRWGNGYAVSQAAFTGGPREMIGVGVVTQSSGLGKVYIGRSSSSAPSGTGKSYGRGGFIQYIGGKYKFCKDGAEYRAAIEADATGGLVDGASCKTIVSAFQQYYIVYNGQRKNNFLNASCRNGMYIFRNIAEKDGKLFFLVSDGAWKLDNWMDKISALGYYNAIYMDSACSWQYGFYKIQSGVKDKITKQNNIKNDVWYWSGGPKTGLKSWSNFITF